MRRERTDIFAFEKTIEFALPHTKTNEMKISNRHNKKACAHIRHIHTRHTAHTHPAC